MYRHFVVTHPIPLILVPNESLVQMLSNVCSMACASVPRSQVLLWKCHTNFTKYGFKIWPCLMAKTVLHNVISLCIYMYMYICICVYIYVHKHICTQARTHARTHDCI